MNALPDSNSPSWLGLPPTAENQLQSQMGQRVLSGVAVLQGGLDEVEYSSSVISGDIRSQLKSISDAATIWLSSLPLVSVLPSVDVSKTSDVRSSPLERCLAREVLKGISVLSLVRDDLQLVKYVSPSPSPPTVQYIVSLQCLLRVCACVYMIYLCCLL